ncbi:hypothetical protein NKG94_09810 [Micromonospora sp. M12]
MPTPGRGVYGMHLHGLDEVSELPPAERAALGWPTVRVSQLDAPPPPPVPLDNRQGIRVLADGRTLALDRVRAPPPSTALCSPRTYWPTLPRAGGNDRQSVGRAKTFHSGAFVLDGRAWAVLGPRTAGKSSLLAALADRVCRC